LLGLGAVGPLAACTTPAAAPPQPAPTAASARTPNPWHPNAFVESVFPYSEANALGCGLREANDGGLTQFGRLAVRRMNKLGIAIDVSHSGDQTSLDTIEVSEQPIFITHVGARALWNTKRMKPDHILKACADKGGAIGIEAAPHTTLTQQHPHHNLESFMQHFEYVANLVGIDHVAFGPDTLFGDHVALHHAFTRQLSIQAAHGSADFEEVPFVDGIESPAEAFPNITRWLVKHNYSDADIAQVLGETSCASSAKSGTANAALGDRPTPPLPPRSLSQGAGG